MRRLLAICAAAALVACGDNKSGSGSSSGGNTSVGGGSTGTTSSSSSGSGNSSSGSSGASGASSTGSSGSSGSSSSSGSTGSSSSSSSSSSSGSTGSGIATPLPPDAATFMWQGQQGKMQLVDGGTCDADVALAASDRAVCFAGADGEMKCAGAVSTVAFGNSFAGTGLTNVDQILISPTRIGTTDGNGLCVHRTDGTAWCLGDYNASGQFGDGTTSAQTSAAQWGSASDLVALGTGNWDQLCALDLSGTVSCAGAGYGSTPAVAADGGADGGISTFWVDTTGAVHADDPTVWRAGEGSSSCVVTAAGLSCSGDVSGTFGTPGQVVAGGIEGGAVPGSSYGICGAVACWLDVAGVVTCHGCDNNGNPLDVQPFGSSAVPAVALGLSRSGGPLCVVNNDGAVRCVGSTVSGLPNPPNAPAGSARVRCR